MRKVILPAVIFCLSTICTSAQTPNIAMKTAMGTDKFVELYILGPKTVQIDYGDGIKRSVTLPTDGLDKGSVKGSEIKIYGDGIYSFDCSGNQLTELDVSNAPELKEVQAKQNKIKAINLANNPKLEKINLFGNQILTIDLSSCPMLEFLSVNKNFYIKSLDLSGNPKLKELYCGSNALTELNVSTLPALEILSCDANKLTTLDLSANTQLLSLYCFRNKLVSLNIENNPKLARIQAFKNLIQELRYKSLENLRSISIYENGLPPMILKQFIDDLPIVKNIRVWPNDRSWLRQLEYKDNPGTAETDALKAKIKGWYCDVLADNWSDSPADCAFLMKTDLAPGTDIEFWILSPYDPFWIDWGGRWGSFLQKNLYKVSRALIEQTVKVYGRGIMEYKCEEKQLTNIDLSANTGTYRIELADNKLRSLQLSPMNIIVSADLRRNELSAEALDTFYKSVRPIKEIENPYELPGTPGFPPTDFYGKIYIDGNPGVKNSHTDILLEKGYTVDVEGITGINTATLPSVQIAYSPRDNSLHSSQPICHLRVYTSDGRLVFRKGSLTDYVRLPALSNGVYMVVYKVKNSKDVVSKIVI